MKKHLIFLVMLISIQWVMAQDTFTSIDPMIDQSYLDKANDWLATYQSDALSTKGYEAKPSSGIVVGKSTILVYDLTKDGISVENDKLVIRLNDKGQIYSINEPRLDLNTSYVIKSNPEALWQLFAEKYSLKAGDINSYTCQIGPMQKSDDPRVYHKWIISDYESNRYLEIKVADADYNDYSITHYGTDRSYDHSGYGYEERGTIQARSNAAPPVTCCESGQTNARIHLTDPTTNSVCSDITVAYMTIAQGDCIENLRRIDDTGNISFTAAPPNIPPTPGANQSNKFCFLNEDPSSTNLECSNERNDINYDKLHSYYYAKILAGVEDGPSNLKLNVDASTDLIVNALPIGTSNWELRFGRSDNYNDFAADQFHIGQAYYQAMLRLTNGSFQPSTNILNGTADFYTHKLSGYYNSSICGAHGGMLANGVPFGEYVQRRSDFTTFLAAYPSSGPLDPSIPAGHHIQAWGSLLMNISDGLGGVEGIGVEKTKILVNEAIASMSDQSIVPTSAIEMYNIAKMLVNFTLDEVCRIRAIMEAYFAGYGGFSLPTDKDIYIKDTEAGQESWGWIPSQGSSGWYNNDEDVGNEPNEESLHFWVSPSIWNCAPGAGSCVEHMDPKFDGANTNTLKVKIHKKGCEDVNGVLKLYASLASTHASWPQGWGAGANGDHYIPDANGNPVLAGRYLGSVDLGNYEDDPNDPLARIYSLNWVPFNPLDYTNLVSNDLNNGTLHMCILGRIVSSDDPMNIEGGNIHDNLKNNNNIAMKNMSVMWVSNIQNPGGGGIFVFDVPAPDDIDCYYEHNVQINPVLPIKYTICTDFIPNEYIKEPHDFAEQGIVVIRMSEKFKDIVYRANGINGEGGGSGYILKGNEIIIPDITTFKLPDLVMDPTETYPVLIDFEPITNDFKPVKFQIVLRDEFNCYTGGELYDIKYASSSKEESTGGRASNTNSLDGNYVVIPNPTKDYITLQGDIEAISKIELISSSGLVQKIIFEENQSKSINIDLSQNQSGMYILVIHDKSGWKKRYKKIVKI